METETKVEYKKTLNLPETTLAMRANATVRELEIQKFWEENDIYNKKSKKILRPLPHPVSNFWFIFYLLSLYFALKILSEYPASHYPARKALIVAAITVHETFPISSSIFPSPVLPDTS